jgi:H+/gluconate symporter-like permease
MTSSDQFPQPDLRDAAGRMRRLVLSLLIGAAAGAIGYFIANTVVKPETQPPTTYVPRQMSAGGFVIWVGAITAVLAFAVALAAQNLLAKRRARAERVPSAKAR